MTLANSLRVVKVLSAIMLLALSFWAMVLPPLFPSSSTSIINAQSVQLKAFTDGTITHLTDKQKVPVKVGDKISFVAIDQEKVKRRLQEEELTALTLRQRLDKITQSIELRSQDVGLSSANLDSTYEVLKTSLSRRRSEIEQKVALQRDLLQTVEIKNQRLKPLLDSSVITQGHWLKSRKEEIEAAQALQLANSELSKIEDDLRALDMGVFTNDGQAHENLMARIQASQKEIRELEMNKINLESELAIATKQIELTQKQLTQNGKFYISSPIHGILWRRHLADGQTASQDQLVAELTSQESIFVEAYFKREQLDSVSLGDMAYFYLINDQELHKGKVEDIQVISNDSREQTLISTIPPGPSTLKAIITPTAPLTVSAIGQRAKVMITNDNPSWVDELMVWFSFLLRSS